MGRMIVAVVIGITLVLGAASSFAQTKCKITVEKTDKADEKALKDGLSALKINVKSISEKEGVSLVEAECPENVSQDDIKSAVEKAGFKLKEVKEEEK